MHQSPPPHASVHWDDLRVFVAVADVQSFSAAARSLGVEPSTIGRRIKRLEDVLGVTLFERHSDGLRPTAASKPLLQHARDAARSIDTLVATAREHPNAGGRVRVACTAAMADLVLVPNMQSFLSEHPALRIDLETGLEFVDVSRGQADVALRSRRPSEHGLVSRKLATMHFAPFATKAYAAAHRAEPPSLWDWLLVRADVVETAWFEKHLGVEPRLTMHSFKAQLDAVRQGLGVGLIASKAAAMFDDLVELALPGLPEPAPFELWLVTQQERRQQPHVRAVIDWLTRLVEEME
ncbi:MAG: LysR family transcriptional regulator [Nannocystales bacterium]